MSCTKAIIVSDSSLLSAALEQSITSGFTAVEKVASITRITVRDDWSETVTIVDAGDPQLIVRELASLNPEHDFSRVIILMRANQNVLDFRSIIGAVGAILPNGSTIAEIALVAQIVRQGLTLVPSDVMSAFSSLPSIETPETAYFHAYLSEREVNVLQLISEGASNKMIARKLDISEGTVRVHVRSILKKLGLQNRTQAALYAIGKKSSKNTVSAHQN